jgi:hypothetical protein
MRGDGALWCLLVARAGRRQGPAGEGLGRLVSERPARIGKWNFESERAAGQAFFAALQKKNADTVEWARFIKWALLTKPSCSGSVYFSPKRNEACAIWSTMSHCTDCADVLGQTNSICEIVSLLITDALLMLAKKATYT